MSKRLRHHMDSNNECEMDTTPSPTIASPVKEEDGKKDDFPSIELSSSSPSSSSSSSEESDSDVDASYGKRGWRNMVREAVRRRSKRVAKTVDRFAPDSGTAHSDYMKSKNVFGDVSEGLLTGTSRRGGPSDIRRLLRQCQQVERGEEENELLRKNMEAEANAIGEDEKDFKSLVDTEAAERAQADEAMTKYCEPLVVFRRRVDITGHEEAYCDAWGSDDSVWEAHDWGQVLHILMKEDDKALSTALAALGPNLRGQLEEETATYSQALVYRLFDLCVFEPGPGYIGVPGRDGLTDYLVSLLREPTVDQAGFPHIPPLIRTLQRYGAVIDGEIIEGEDKSTFKEEDLEPMSLERLSMLHMDSKKMEKEERQLEVGIRNVGRACQVAAVLVERGWTWRSAIGIETDDEREGIVQTCLFCTRLLLSRFGSRAKRKIGAVLKAAARRAEGAEWPSIRWELAKRVVLMTNRLHLHSELVTHLFPVDYKRTLNCSLDIAYASLLQWGRGPASAPEARDVSKVEISTDAQWRGIHQVSFTLGDVVRIVREIGVFDKETDIVWACGIGRVLKQVATIGTVVRRRGEGDAEELEKLMKKMTMCSHRMVYDVAVQDMRMALNAATRALVYIAGMGKHRKQVQVKLKADSSGG